MATGALLAGLCALLPQGGSPVFADDQNAASGSDKGSGEQAGTAAARSTTSQPAATPTPKPSPTPRVKIAQPKRPDVLEKTPAPAQTPGQALRFDDFDLEKYHKPIPKPDEGEGEDESEAGPVAGTPPAVAPGGTLPPAGKTTKAPRPKPKAIAAQPEGDPLKPFKDREAKEKFRQMQIDTARDHIAKLQARLDYLTAKKNALQNPAPLMAGQTRGPATPPTPIQGPGKVAIGGFFPPLPPPQTDQDKENDKKLKVKDLIDQVDAEIKSVQDEMETAKDELASVETRFAQESQSR